MEDFRAKTNLLMEKVQTALEEVFDMETEQPIIVVGVQTSGLGDAGELDPDYPKCALLTNLSVHAVGLAIEDMASEAALMHEAAHAGDPLLPEGFMRTNPADVPEEVRAYAQKIAEGLGIPVENVVFQSMVDTDDLSEESLPEWLRGSEVAEAMTGGDIADPALDQWQTDYDSGANTAEAEQAHESGSEQEG
jgi:hypothetical protein